jgi:hypothetical protein
MSNLVDTLTPTYFREFFRGSLFTYDNKVCMVNTINNGGMVEVHWIPLNDKVEREQWQVMSIPSDTFQSFSALAWPKLGYRNLHVDMLGNCVTFVGTARSVMRGLREETMTFTDLPVVQCTGYSATESTPASWNGYRFKQIFKPKWIAFSEGIKQIRAGEWACFAMNEDIAIGLSVDQAQGRFCDIYFREKVVGWISDDGRVEIANKVIKRGHMKSILTLLEGK